VLFIIAFFVPSFIDFVGQHGIAFALGVESGRRHWLRKVALWSDGLCLCGIRTAGLVLKPRRYSGPTAPPLH